MHAGRDINRQRQSCCRPLEVSQLPCPYADLQQASAGTERGGTTHRVNTQRLPLRLRKFVIDRRQELLGPHLVARRQLAVFEPAPRQLVARRVGTQGHLAGAQPGVDGRIDERMNAVLGEKGPIVARRQRSADTPRSQAGDCPQFPLGIKQLVDGEHTPMERTGVRQRVGRGEQARHLRQRRMDRLPLVHQFKIPQWRRQIDIHDIRQLLRFLPSPTPVDKGFQRVRFGQDPRSQYRTGSLVR